MFIFRKFILFLFLLIAVILHAEEISGIDLRYGLELGIKKKDAKKMLEAEGFGKIEEVSDSKEIDNILLAGSVAESFAAESGVQTESELEFYEDSLMNAIVTYKVDDVFLLKQLENKYSGILTNMYGGPRIRDSVMGINSWIWEKGEFKIVFSSNNRKKKLQVSYMYLPLITKKYEKEMKIKLKGAPPDVAKESFLK